jgi:GDPmannose 4,6-dehydratase
MSSVRESLPDITNSTADEMQAALITGINGQDGSYLAELLLEQRYRVVGLMRSGEDNTRTWRIEHLRRDIELIQVDSLDESELGSIIERHQPSEIYNLAARASSAQLFSDPLLTADVNGMAIVRWLEAIRASGAAIRFCQASSSEMFGDAPHSPQDEITPLRPKNPYGVAKLFAHGMLACYREQHGVFACSAILFNHESPRRGAEFVTRKISMGVAKIKAGMASELYLGDLEALRDWGYAGDYVRGMWQMLQAQTPNDYVLATGELHSVREFCEVAFSHVGLNYLDHVRIDPGVRRPPESAPRQGDAGRARAILDWRPTVSFEELVHMMVDADIHNLSR